MEDRLMTKKEIMEYNKALERELVKFRDALVPALEELKRNTEDMEKLCRDLRDDLQKKTTKGGCL